MSRPESGSFLPGKRPATASVRHGARRGSPPPVRAKRPQPGECRSDAVLALCQKTGFALTVEQGESLTEYLRLLMQWNKAMNLVGARDWREALENLVMDSFWLARFLSTQICPAMPNFSNTLAELARVAGSAELNGREGSAELAGQEKMARQENIDGLMDELADGLAESAPLDFAPKANSAEKDVIPDCLPDLPPDLPQEEHEIWDLGAGAGLPGLPLRMLWQPGAYHMVEAREKRALFLSTILARLNLPQTFVFRGRAEQFMAQRKASIILSRAFMPWRDVLGLVHDHIKPEGRVILLTLEPLFPAQGKPKKRNIPPEGWQAAESMAYPIADGMRYFCSFTPIKAPS